MFWSPNNNCSCYKYILNRETKRDTIKFLKFSMKKNKLQMIVFSSKNKNKNDFLLFQTNKQKNLIQQIF